MANNLIMQAAGIPTSWKSHAAAHRKARV